jgi:nucleoside-diphosphate-sugar epimerase
MNILLTSATGYIGQAVAQALLAAGHNVVAIARSESSVRRLLAVGVLPYRGDLMDAEGLTGAAQQADAVIHTAATNDAQMAEVDRQVVEVLLGALEGTQKPFVYTSGVWVMGDTAGEWVDETAPLNPPAIVAWRPAIEERVLAAAQRGVRSMVIRPALVYGHGGGLMAMLIQAGRDRGAIPVIADGRHSWPLVHVDDLARLYVNAMERAAAGTVWIGAGAGSPTMKSVALAAAAAAAVEGVEFLSLEEAQQLWGVLADALALDQRVSSDRARQQLNWIPSAPDVITELTHGSYRPAIAPEANSNSHPDAA